MQSHKMRPADYIGNFFEMEEDVMKFKAKIAAALVLSLILQGIPAMMPGEPQIVVREAGQEQQAENTGGQEIVMPQPGQDGGVVTAYAADPSGSVTPEATIDPTTISFHFVYNGKNYAQGDVIKLEENITNQIISIESSYGFIEDGTVCDKWYGYNKDVIQIVETSTSNWSGEITICGIGTTEIRAEIKDKAGRLYSISCQVQVPFSYCDENKDKKINIHDGNFGMVSGLRGNETEYDKAIQLSTQEDPAKSHYLPMFRFVKYKNGVNSTTVKVNSGDLIDVSATSFVPFIVDTSKTDPNVATVDEDGYIQAVGAGYTTVRFLPINKNEKDAIELPIIVAPRAKLKDSQGNFEKKPKIQLKAGTTSFEVQTNAKIASKLEWTLYHKTVKENNKIGDNNNGKETEIDTKYMHIYISENDDTISFSALKAGVYHLVGSQVQYKNFNTSVETVDIEIVVPIGISEERLVMNVGDIYDVLLNAQILDKEIFQGTVADNPNETGVPSNKASYSNGILKAELKGDTYLVLTYMGKNDADKDVFGSDDYVYDENDPEGTYYAYKDRYVIPVTIIDDLSLNMTQAVMSLGGTLQLIAKVSNLSVPLKWTSSDESILKVDGDGLVTALKEGTATIRVTQTINGVTKTAECIIDVVGAVTKIVLDPPSKTIGINDLLTINAKITPNINNVSLKWVTSDATIVSIEQPGDLSTTVKGLKEGIAVITAINQENVVVGSCMVTVVGDHAIKKITLSQTNVTTSLAEKSFVLYATITPPDAENEPVVWSSSDNSVATVDQKGLVTLRKSGTVTIICTAKNDSAIAASCRVTITQSVTGIRLDQSNINMNVGETFRLTYLLTPANASNTAVTFTSTNPAIATVNNLGVVSARGVGQTAIILKTNEGGFMATCLVNVGRVATAVKLDATAITLNVGDYYTFETTITPADSTDTALTWEVSDKSVAVVSNKGKVIAKKVGVSVIMAKTKSGSTAYCTVTVQQGVTGVKLDDHEGVIYIGDEWELNATVSPKGATSQELKWNSSDRSVATVDAEGRIKGVKEGLTIITCTTVDGGYVDYCAVQVIPNEVASEEIIVKPESCLLGVGKKMKLEVQVLPENTTDKTVEWSSSNTDIVKVDEKGRITGVAVGNAVITCTAADGSGAEGYCEVEVCQQITDIRLDTSYLDMVVGDTETISGWIYPSDATYGVKWTSDDPTIAIVDALNGRVTALKAGDTVVRATAEDESGVEAICIVHVRNPVPITNIQVSESEIVMIPGESKTVSFTILPAGYTDDYVWSSDNPVVADVNKTTGLITANAMGTANITIFADSGRSASVKVYVVGLSKTSLSLQQYTSTLISLEVYGASKSDLDVRWYSENERIAEVRGGQITGKALGTTYVYAVVNGRRLACRVTVEKIRR